MIDRCFRALGWSWGARSGPVSVACALLSAPVRRSSAWSRITIMIVRIGTTVTPETARALLLNKALHSFHYQMAPTVAPRRQLTLQIDPGTSEGLAAPPSLQRRLVTLWQDKTNLKSWSRQESLLPPEYTGPPRVKMRSIGSHRSRSQPQLYHRHR